MVSLALAPFGWWLALSIGVITWAGIILLFWLLSPKIAVSDSELRAGKISIPRSVIGQAIAFQGDEARQAKGPRLSPAAALLLRGDIGPVVKIEILDPQDPTPYLLLSTRRPGDLVAALS